MKQRTQEEWAKDCAKVEKLMKDVKELQRNLELLKAERKLREAERFLENLRAKYIPEKVTFT